MKKAVAIQKAVNVIKMDSWTSPADFRYQDETSEFKMECDHVAAQKRGELYVPKPWESLPYLAKEELGRIHVRGFLHDRIAQNPDGSFTHPASLSTEQTITRLSRAWKVHAAKSRDTGISHHRLVFSLSKEFHDSLVQGGRNPDIVLGGVIERTMRSLQEKFHAGDSVGYSYGIHHDTDNLHAHIFIHPRTREGAFVGMSGKLKKFRGHETRHKDQLGFVRENVRRRVAQVLREVARPHDATNEIRKNLHSDRAYFVPRQSHATRGPDEHRPRTPAENYLERKRAAVAAVDKQITAKREALREASQGAHIAALFQLRQPRWLKLLKRALAAKLFRELRELQRARYQLASDYRAARRLHIPPPHGTRTARRRKRIAVEPPAATPAPKPTVTQKPGIKPRRQRHTA